VDKLTLIQEEELNINKQCLYKSLRYYITLSLKRTILINTSREVVKLCNLQVSEEAFKKK